MAQMTSEDLRNLCLRRAKALRRRIDDLKASGTGQPLVGIDFLADVEKTLDGWEMYEEALARERKRDC